MKIRTILATGALALSLAAPALAKGLPTGYMLEEYDGPPATAAISTVEGGNMFASKKACYAKLGEDLAKYPSHWGACDLYYHGSAGSKSAESGGAVAVVAPGL